MATDVFIHSGLTGTAGQIVKLDATVSSFVLLFQDDLQRILDEFKEVLGIDVAVNRFVPQPSKGKFAMVRFESFQLSQATRQTSYTFQIILGRAGNQTALKGAPSALSVEYTLERLVRLLQANGNFGHFAGITNLVSAEGGVSPPGANFFVQGKNVEEAVLLVTYLRDEPQNYHSNR